MVNIELYRTFIAIYRAGTISKAAVLCDITQPAASQQLASLEKTLQVKLFERTPREMVATNDGHELYTKVADSFDWLDFVSQDFILQRQEKEALLRIGVPRDFYTKVLASKVLTLPFRVDVHFGEHTTLETLLQNGKIDLLISHQKVVHSSMFSEKIMHQKFVLLGSTNVKAPEDGFASWKSVRAWVRKQHWLSYDAELTLIRHYFKSLYNLQPNIEPKCIVPDTMAILDMLIAGEGVAILPKYLCQEALDKKQVKLLHAFDGDDERYLYVSCEQSVKGSVLVRKFRELL